MAAKKRETLMFMEFKKAKSMEYMMRMEMEKLRSKVLIREVAGFELCYNLFKEFYSDKLKEDE